MKFEYCAIINRRTEEDSTDFTDLPFDDLSGLSKVVEAALNIPYVESAHISEKAQEIDGKPWWGRHVFERGNPNVDGRYTNENQFKHDLKAALNDDHLFDAIYKAKQEYKTLMGL